jgi:short-subunit dehydrogenase
MSVLGGKVLITGATGGLGHAIARAFARRGSDLLLTGRRLEALDQLAAETSASALACDLGDRDAVAQLASEAGDVDVFVANAALPASGVLTDLAQAQLDTILEVNLRAPIALARALVPAMRLRRRGHLVFVSSIAGKATAPASSMYSATKFGLRGFALGLRQDLGADGVGVSVVLPGFIRGAGMFAESGVSLPFGVGTRTPEDVADAVIRCIEDNRAEATVAPVPLRLGTAFAGLAPGIAAVVSRQLGSHRMAAEIAANQLDKRP